MTTSCTRAGAGITTREGMHPRLERAEPVHLHVVIVHWPPPRVPEFETWTVAMAFAFIEERMLVALIDENRMLGAREDGLVGWQRVCGRWVNFEGTTTAQI